jgi:hypothetical protein
VAHGRAADVEPEEALPGRAVEVARAGESIGTAVLGGGPAGLTAAHVVALAELVEESGGGGGDDGVAAAAADTFPVAAGVA